jgi:MFS family permease
VLHRTPRATATGHPTAGPPTPWPHVVTTWLAGVQAAIGLGAIAPVAPAVQRTLGLSLGTVAGATSSMTAVGAVLGIPAGWWCGRLRARRALVTGLVVVSAAAGLSALADSWPVLLAARTGEGVGYLLVFVSGPIVLTGLTRGRARAAALALWGTCVPTGLALAAGAGGALATHLAWQHWLALTGVVPLLLAGVLTATLPDPPTAPAPGPDRPRTTGGWGRSIVPAAAYGCLSLISVAVLVILPSFLTGTRHATSAAAGAAAAFVCAWSAAGGLLASRLLRRGLTMKSLTPLGVLIPLACLPAFSAGVPVSAGVAAAALLLAVNGLLISTVFAVIPVVVRRSEGLDLANGALAQCGSLGVLLGPPVFGVLVGYAGWGAVAATTALFTAAATALLLATARGLPARAPHTGNDLRRTD